MNEQWDIEFGDFHQGSEGEICCFRIIKYIYMMRFFQQTEVGLGATK